MNSNSSFGCLNRCLALGCLFVVLLILGGYLFFTKKPLETILFVLPNVDKKAAEEPVYWGNTKGNLVARIALLSDSEGANNQVEKIVKLSNVENLDAVIHLGDLTPLGVKKDLASTKDTLDLLTIPYYVVPGDRDLYYSHGLDAFNEYFGDSYYFKEIKGLGFLFIDNSNEYEGINKDEWVFIEENISRSDFVVLHNPLLTTDIPYGGNKRMGEYDSSVSEQRDRLLELVRNSNVKAIFAGDQHYYSETRDNVKKDLIQIVVGSVNEVRNLQTPRFVILELYDQGGFNPKVVTLE